MSSSQCHGDGIRNCGKYKIIVDSFACHGRRPLALDFCSRRNIHRASPFLIEVNTINHDNN